MQRFVIYATSLQRKDYSIRYLISRDLNIGSDRSRTFTNLSIREKIRYGFAVENNRFQMLNLAVGLGCPVAPDFDQISLIKWPGFFRGSCGCSLSEPKRGCWASLPNRWHLVPFETTSWLQDAISSAFFDPPGFSSFSDEGL